MPIKVTGRRMANGNGHQHIAALAWANPTTGKTGMASRSEMVSFIETNGDNSVWCPDKAPSKPGQWVHVNSNGSTKYVQTFADGRWTDNLLALPEC